MATQSSTLAWRIPWTEEPGRLQSMGSLRVGHDWATSLHFSLSCIGEGNGNSLHCSCLENPRGGGAWWAAVYGVAQSQTRLKWLSSRGRVFLISVIVLSLYVYSLILLGLCQLILAFSPFCFQGFRSSLLSLFWILFQVVCLYPLHLFGLLCFQFIPSFV